MALQATSFPINVPSGVRMTAGTLNWNGATYTVNGDSFTAAQWGGGSNGIPNRTPDFVLFNAGARNVTGGQDGSTSTGFSTQARYVTGGKVQLFGEEALVADSGLTEMDAEACLVEVQFLAIWLESTPGTLA